MAAGSSPHEARVKTSSQTAVKPSAQRIIIFGGATSLMLVALDLKLGCFMAPPVRVYPALKVYLEEVLTFALQLIDECAGRL